MQKGAVAKRMLKNNKVHSLWEPKFALVSYCYSDAKSKGCYIKKWRFLRANLVLYNKDDQSGLNGF